MGASLDVLYWRPFGAELFLSLIHILLMVDDIVIMNVGDWQAQKKILAEGVGIVLHPKDDNARAILNNVGQRQAILHNLAALVGSKVEAVSYTHLFITG